MPQSSIAKPSHLSKKSIGQLAEQVSRDLDYHKTKNIRECVVRIGGRIKVRDFWGSDQKTGSLFVRGEGDFDIFVPQHTSIERDNFTIAHELGHYVLHFLFCKNEIEPPLEADRYGSGRVEWEANWFAASFLMPEEKFKKALQTAGNDIKKVAKDFQVSEDAAKVRAKSLGMDL